MPEQPFDAAAWLAEFEVVGGWYVVGDRDHITIGWQVFGSDDSAQLRARELYREVEEGGTQRDQLKAHILASRKDLQPAIE